MKRNLNIGIVGATGAVGQELIHLIESRGFPVGELRLLASSRSVGKTLPFRKEPLEVREAAPQAFEGLDLVFFSAGASLSLDLAPAAVKAGCVVVDNSSAFRGEDEVPLVVPEVNPEAAARHRGLLANPNCSTAIGLMGLAPLHRAFGLKRFFCSTYQAVSGSGAKAVTELEQQSKAWASGEAYTKEVYPHPIAFNLIPQVDRFLEDGYTKEEQKMLWESRKILGLNELRVSCTCVRVPVFRAHSLSVFAEFEQEPDLDRARAAIRSFPGLELRDDPAAGDYPMPIDYSGKEKCGVGRLRRDQALERGLAFWVVGDQLWKGAALNALQIAELLVDRGWLKQEGIE